MDFKIFLNNEESHFHLSRFEYFLTICHLLQKYICKDAIVHHPENCISINQELHMSLLSWIQFLQIHFCQDAILPHPEKMDAKVLTNDIKLSKSRYIWQRKHPRIKFNKCISKEGHTHLLLFITFHQSTLYDAIKDATQPTVCFKAFICFLQPGA